MADDCNNNEKEEEFIIKKDVDRMNAYGYTDSLVVYSSKTGVHYGVDTILGAAFYDDVRGSYGTIDRGKISFENAYSKYSYDQYSGRGEMYKSGYGIVEFKSDGYTAYRPSDKWIGYKLLWSSGAR